MYFLVDDNNNHIYGDNDLKKTYLMLLKFIHQEIQILIKNNIKKGNLNMYFIIKLENNINEYIYKFDKVKGKLLDILNDQYLNFDKDIHIKILSEKIKKTFNKIKNNENRKEIYSDKENINYNKKEHKLLIPLDIDIDIDEIN